MERGDHDAKCRLPTTSRQSPIFGKGHVPLDVEVEQRDDLHLLAEISTRSSVSS